MTPLKKKTALVYGLAGIVTSWLSPLIAMTLGFIGLILSLVYHKTSPYSYRMDALISALAILAGLAWYLIPSFLAS
ncbi:hypothetical protein [Streptococcus sp. DD12]|uniref:hypothetical protein n=1 Tax=Streptococcus sp. DD12 TaxID=1777880 RepID=UPI0007969F1B|nr:hypothetical protein [Streptococcus sp. DD12]KXT75764.1 hypothetical protein STRDD12_00876 [Streptococcus sp. DD12]